MTYCTSCGARMEADPDAGVRRCVDCGATVDMPEAVQGVDRGEGEHGPPVLGTDV